MFGTVLVGGLWAASAVYIAGWTWRAFSTTYTSFPDQGQQSAAGGLNTRAEGQKLGETAISKIPIVGGPLEKASQALGSAFGTEPNLNPQQIARLQKLPAPPARIVNQLRRSLSGTPNPAVSQRVAQEFVQWATSHGYTRADVRGYFILHPDVLGPLTPTGE